MPFKSYLIYIFHILFLLVPSTFSQNPPLPSYSVNAPSISLEEEKAPIETLHLKSSCEPEYYLYPNGTCGPKCETPFVIQTQNGVPICLEPQDNHNRGRSKTLRSLKEKDTLAITSPDPIDKSYSITDLDTFLNSQEVSDASSIISLLSCVLQPANPAPLLQVLISQLTSTMRYMNINYPEDLQKTLASTIPIQMNLGFQMPRAWKNKFSSSRSLQGLNSNYLVNDWKNLTTYLFIFFVIGALGLTNFVRKALKLTGKSLSKHLYIAFKWNIALVIFFSGLYELVLFSSIELLTFKSQRLFNILSLITCLSMIIIAFLVMLKLFHLTKKTRRTSVSTQYGTSLDKAFMNKHKSFQVLFSGFPCNSLLNQRFLLISLLRTITTSIIIIPLHAFPLSQASINTIMSCAMIIYLVWNKPLVSRLNFIQSIVLEISLLIVNIFTLALTLAEDNENLISNIASILKVILLIQSINIKAFVIFSLVHNIYKAYKAAFPAKAPQDPVKLATINEVEPEEENDNIRLVIGASSSQFVSPRSISQTSSQNNNWKRLRISGMIDLDIESDYQKPGTAREHRHTQSGSESNREIVSRRKRRVRTMAPKSQDQRGHV